MTQIDQTQAIGRCFGRIHKLIRARMRTSWHDLGLFRGQNEILFMLWREEGLTQSDLASRTLVAPATITNSLQRMERDGWITRRSDPQDQRISRVYLTDQGRAVQQPVRDLLSKLEQDMLKGFSDEEQEHVRGYLERIMQNLLDASQQHREE